MYPASSRPTAKRRLIVALLIGIGLIVGVAVKQFRPDLAHTGLDPLGLGGNAPDFLFTFGAMMFPLLSPAVVPWKFFVRNGGLIFLGCIAYEVSQLWTAGRTFDVRDILAMCLGALLAFGISWKYFFDATTADD
jgi:hypothetical protein